MTSSISPRSSPSCAPRPWSPRPSASTASRMRASSTIAPSAPVLRSASASTSITSPPCATRAAAAIPIRCAPRELAIAAGADGITAHLREDRRHIGDDDIARLKAAHHQAAQSRNGGDRRRWWRSRCELQAARRLHRAGAPRRSAPPKAGSTSPASAMRCAPCVARVERTPASGCRCSSPPSRGRSKPRPASARR